MQTALGPIPQRLLRHMSMGEAHDYLRARRSRTRREFLKDAALVGAAAAAGPLIWARPAWAAGPPVGLHVNVGNDPRSAITVSWSTSGGVVSPRLQIGTEPNQYGTTYDADSRPIHGHPSVYHHATVTGLVWGSEYFYRATHDDGSVGATGSFTTAPPGPQPFRFVAMGDMGATAAGATLTNRIVNLVPQPDCVFMVGDLCYADRLGGAAEPPEEFAGQPEQDLSQWDLWFAQIQPSASRVPWIFTVGNHEMELGQGDLGYDGFRARITLPGGGAGADSPTYVTRWGNVAFVALDANDVSYEIRKNTGYTGGLQQSWVAAALAALRADPAISFIVVGFHHCMYCSNTVHASDGGVRDAWGALFDQYQVDLVINGHNHSYERTHAVRGGAVTAQVPIGGEIDTSRDGTVYVTAGAGGQAAYPSTLHPASYVTQPDGTRLPETADWSAVRYLGDHSLLVVDVFPAGAEPARMEVKAVPNSTCTPSPCTPAPPELVDHFSIVRADTAIIPVMSPGLQLPLAALLAAGGVQALRRRQA